MCVSIKKKIYKREHMGSENVLVSPLSVMGCVSVSGSHSDRRTKCIVTEKRELFQVIAN